MQNEMRQVTEEMRQITEERIPALEEMDDRDRQTRIRRQQHEEPGTTSTWT